MDRSVRVWSVDSDPKACQGLLTKNNSGHSDVVTSVTTLSMGEAQYFLTGSMDRHVKVWNSSGGCDHDQQCGGPVLSPMPGTVTVVEVTEGQRVAAGDRLVVVEAMKMEHVLTAPVDGVVRELRARAGATVARDAALLIVEGD